MMGFEPMTSSLPRKCSAPELHWLENHNIKKAGNETRTRDPQLGRLMLYQLSYSRNLYVCGEGRIRTYEGISQQIYSLPRLTASVPPLKKSRWTDSNRRPADYKSAALPTELHRQLIFNRTHRLVFDFRRSNRCANV